MRGQRSVLSSIFNNNNNNNNAHQRARARASLPVKERRRRKREEEQPPLLSNLIFLKPGERKARNNDAKKSHAHTHARERERDKSATNSSFVPPSRLLFKNEKQKRDR